MTPHEHLLVALKEIDAIYCIKPGESCEWPRMGWESRLPHDHASRIPPMSPEEHAAWHSYLITWDENTWYDRDRKSPNPWLWLQKFRSN